MSVSYEDWAAALSEGDLRGVSCTDCNATYGTPVSVCHECGGRALESIALPTEGELYSVTQIAVPPAGFDGPYSVGLVAVGDARLLARIDSGGSDTPPTIGASVVLSGIIEEDRNGLPAPVFTVAE